MMNKRQKFIDRTARKPFGEQTKKRYSDPKGHYKSFKMILEKLKLTKSDNFVEIGFGGGVLLKQALQYVSDVSGIDHSADMLELAKAKLENTFYNHLDLIQGDAAKLPWGNESFNTAACANMFFFVEEPQKVLNEIYRVLKPGGRFAMVTMSNSFLGKIIFGWLYSLKTYSTKDMILMLEKAGFKNIEVKSSLKQVCYAEK